LHRPEEALAELQIVRDAAPREVTVHFAMGKVLKSLGRPDEAMKCFLAALDLDPKDNQPKRQSTVQVHYGQTR
jgi:anaphase-promoting complex subunit 3